MGINIKKGKILYDATHHQLINSSQKSNPTVTVLKGLTVHAVFQRIRHRSKSGDGNPLIYALKKQRNFYISRLEILRFLPDFYAILNKLKYQYQSGVVIVPIPSSHAIASTLARRVHRLIPNSIIAEDLLCKRSCAEVHSDLLLGQLPADVQEFKQLLAFLKKNSEIPISLKDVDVKLRYLVRPLAFNPQVQLPQFKSVLLVDDLMATGSTLLNARELFLGLNPLTTVKGVCLLGKL